MLPLPFTLTSKMPGRTETQSSLCARDVFARTLAPGPETKVVFVFRDWMLSRASKEPALLSGPPQEKTGPVGKVGCTSKPHLWKPQRKEPAFRKLSNSKLGKKSERSVCVCSPQISPKLFEEQHRGARQVRLNVHTMFISPHTPPPPPPCRLAVSNAAPRFEL